MYNMGEIEWMRGVCTIGDVGARDVMRAGCTVSDSGGARAPERFLPYDRKILSRGSWIVGMPWNALEYLTRPVFRSYLTAAYGQK